MRHRKIFLGVLVLVLIGFISAQAQTVSTHGVVRMLSAEGDVTVSDLKAALGRWQLELYNLPHKTDFFQADYLVDADENGKFEVGVDPVYAIKGQPRLVTVSATARCGAVPLIEMRVHVLADFELFINGQPQGGKQFGTMLLLSLGDGRGPWLMMLSLDLNGDGVSESVTGLSYRFSLPFVPPLCPP